MLLSLGENNIETLFLPLFFVELTIVIGSRNLLLSTFMLWSVGYALWHIVGSRPLWRHPGPPSPSSYIFYPLYDTKHDLNAIICDQWHYNKFIVRRKSQSASSITWLRWLMRRLVMRYKNKRLQWNWSSREEKMLQTLKVIVPFIKTI
jgi:hypothetical protein